MGEPVKRLCTILARGGSKGLPGKNLRRLSGKPLIVHTIVQAKESELFDTIAVSSEPPEILDAARRLKIDFAITRPPHLATNTASKIEAIQHCASEVERRMGGPFDVIVDLDVTSPLRSVEDIRGAVALLEDEGVTNVITGSAARKVPYFNLVERAASGYVTLSKPPRNRLDRRQDCPECFDMNAAVYAWRRDAFVDRPDVFYADTLLYEMPPERSHDIDTPLDFEIVELLMSRR